MISISLCMIVKNEEDVIGRCLECVKGIADEIIIVDTGSSDRTKEIVKNYTDKIFDFEWIDDFSAARNFSFSKAEKDFVMWLDADDVILPEDRENWIALKETLEPYIQGVMMKYNVMFDDQGKPTFSYYRERLIKNHIGLKWIGPVHEVISLSGPTLYSEIAVCHKKLHAGDPDRNLRIFENMIAQEILLDARQQFYYGRELFYHNRFNDAINVIQQFFDEEKGWVENNIDACKILAYCYYAIKEDKKALYSLFRSLEYDIPRAEICCEIGKHFCDREQYKTAVFWYVTALEQERDDTTGAFISQDCYGYIPFIQLCVCYDKMGDFALAKEYNEKAGVIKPNDSSYLQNKKYFEQRQNS